MSAQKPGSWSHDSTRALYVSRDVVGCTDAGDEDDTLRGRRRAVAVVEAMHEVADVLPALAGPCRTAGESSFTAQESPAATSNPAAAIRRRASTPAWYHESPVAATHPPGGDVDLGEGVEVGAERTDRRGRPAARLSLVGDERRHRDVVLRARRVMSGQPLREPDPVARGVEDRPQRPAPVCAGLPAPRRKSARRRSALPSKDCTQGPAVEAPQIATAHDPIVPAGPRR